MKGNPRAEKVEKNFLEKIKVFLDREEKLEYKHSSLLVRARFIDK